MVEAWPESVKERTPVLKNLGQRETGGELLIHLVLKNPNVTAEMVMSIVEAWPESLKEKTTVMRMQSAITKGQVSTAAHVALATLAAGRSAVTETIVQGSLASRV